MKKVELYEITKDVYRLEALNDAGNFFLCLMNDTIDIPSVGDLIVLDIVTTKDSIEKAFIYNGLATPFRVIEKTKYFMWDKDNSVSKYTKTCIYVERISKDDYFGKIIK